MTQADSPAARGALRAIVFALGIGLLSGSVLYACSNDYNNDGESLGVAFFGGIGAMMASGAAALQWFCGSAADLDPRRGFEPIPTAQEMKHEH